MESITSHASIDGAAPSAHADETSGLEDEPLRLADVKDKVQQDYLEARRNQETRNRFEPGSAEFAIMRDATEARGKRNAFLELDNASPRKGSLTVSEKIRNISKQSPARKPSKQEPTPPQETETVSKAGKKSWVKVRKAVNRGTRVLHAVKAFSRQQNLTGRMQDNLARRHIYGLAKLCLEDVHHADDSHHGMLDIFYAVCSGTRQLLLKKRVSNVLMAYLIERRARVKLTKIVQDHLRAPRWDTLLEGLHFFDKEMHDSRVEHDGLADTRTYENICSSMTNTVRRLQTIELEASAVLSRIESSQDPHMLKDALGDANVLRSDAENLSGDLSKLLSFLGACTGRRSSAASIEELISGQHEDDLLADVPEQALTKIRDMLSDFEMDTETREKLCMKELVTLGASEDSAVTILSALRRQVALRCVTPLMTEMLAPFEKKVERINTVVEERVLQKVRAEAERTTVSKNKAESRDTKAWRELVSSFQSPTLIEEANRLELGRLRSSKDECSRRNSKAAGRKVTKSKSAKGAQQVAGRMKSQPSDHFSEVAAIALKNITFRRESDKPIPGIDVPASGDQLSLIPDCPSPIGQRTIGTPSDEDGISLPPSPVACTPVEYMSGRDVKDDSSADHVQRPSSTADADDSVGASFGKTFSFQGRFKEAFDLILNGGDAADDKNEHDEHQKHSETGTITPNAGIALDGDGGIVGCGEWSKGRKSDGNSAERASIDNPESRGHVSVGDEDWRDGGSKGHDKLQATHTFKGEMGIACSEDGIVQEVIDNKPADIKGIRAGQKIVNVGTESFSKERLRNAEHSGSHYHVTVHLDQHQRFVASPKKDEHTRGAPHQQSIGTDVQSSVSDVQPVKSSLPSLKLGNLSTRSTRSAWGDESVAKHTPRGKEGGLTGSLVLSGQERRKQADDTAGQQRMHSANLSGKKFSSGGGDNSCGHDPYNLSALKQSFAKLCMNVPDPFDSYCSFGAERDSWNQDSRQWPLDNIVASRLNLSLSRAITPRSGSQGVQASPVGIDLRPKTPIISPRRRPHHAFKDQSELENVMQERHNRERWHGRVMLDPFDRKSTRIRK